MLVQDSFAVEKGRLCIASSSERSSNHLFPSCSHLLAFGAEREFSDCILATFDASVVLPFFSDTLSPPPSIDMLFASLISTLALAGSAQAFFRLPCDNPLVVERVDPIISPGKVAGHTHTISGGSGFSPFSDFTDLRKSKCSSCRAKADLSGAPGVKSSCD